MEKITIKNEMGQCIFKRPICCDRCGEEMYDVYPDFDGITVAEKLGSYEDTNLTPAEIEALKRENKQWNDADCNICPLNSWESCDEKCVSKATLIEFAVSLSKDIDIKLAALLDAEDKVEALKAKLQKVERERDAAVEELKIERGCFACKIAEECAEAFYHDECAKWKWRGLEDTTCE